MFSENLTPGTEAVLEWNGLREYGAAMRKTSHGKTVRLLPLVMGILVKHYELPFMMLLINLFDVAKRAAKATKPQSVPFRLHVAAKT